MTAQLLEGAPAAEAVLEQVRKRVAALRRNGTSVGLGTILVGEDPASAGYVRKKHDTCAQVGIESFDVQIPLSAGQGDLLAAVDWFNEDDRVSGYLIQHPVPEGFDFNAALLAMDPAKDADGLHPVNLGNLVLQEPGPVPATPAGIQAIFQHYGLEIAGREVVIVGRGPTLGRPLSLLLTLKAHGENAAVTVVHSAVERYTRRADIVISAVGTPGIVQPHMLKPGAIAVSGGITWDGRKLLPDVAEECAEGAGWITPRLGGVGVTTVAMLLRNTVALAEERARP